MANRNPFSPTRTDGRSDRQVIYDLLSAAEPDTVFTWEQLTVTLQQGTERQITRRHVYGAVRLAAPLLEKEKKRTVSLLRYEGYRIARADEHMMLSRKREDRARNQVRRGIHVLENVRWDELDPTVAQLHRGQLMIMRGFADAIDTTNSRVRRLEDMVADLVASVGPGTVEK